MVQQTLEEAAERYVDDFAMSVKSARKIGFIDGYNKAKEDYEVVSSVREVHQYKLGLDDGYNKAKERMYSEEQVIELIQFLSMSEYFNGYGSVSKETASYFLEQFKKKSNDQ